MPPFVQPHFGIIKGFGYRLFENCNESKDKIGKMDFQKLALSKVANETKGIIMRFYCILNLGKKCIIYKLLSFSIKVIVKNMLNSKKKTKNKKTLKSDKPSALNYLRW